MFESNYVKYQEILSGKCTDINLIINSHLIYDELKKDSINIYDSIDNKKEWVTNEILSLVNKNIVIPINFNVDFKNYYSNSLLRFLLINDYLKNKHLTFDITSHLYKVYDFFLNIKKINDVLHILFIMTTNSINNQSTYEFIDKLLQTYTEDKNYEDKTLIFEIYNFVEENYSADKLNYLKNKFNLSNL